MSTKTTQQAPATQARSLWKGPLLAFAGGALLGLAILPFIPSRENHPGPSTAVAPRGQPIVSLEERSGEQATASPSPSPAAPREIDRNGFEPVDFDILSGFTLTGQTRLPGATTGDLQSPSIPDHIRELDGKRVAVEGFMLPIRVDRNNREVREMFLMKDHALCCFGEEPEANEFIYVQLEEGTGVPILTELPVRLYGELEVRSNHRDILMEGLYRMRGLSVERL